MSPSTSLRKEGGGRSVAATLLLATLLVVLVLTMGLAAVMIHFMNDTAESILLKVMRPMARTAAQNVEANLHTMVDRLHVLKGNSFLRNPNALPATKQEALDRFLTSVELVWLGLYDNTGVLVTGIEGSPTNVTEREIFSRLVQTRNMVIEDTVEGQMGLEVALGVPIHTYDQDAALEPPRYFLVGGYLYDILEETIDSLSVGNKGSAFVIDDSGLIIGSPGRSDIEGSAPLAEALGGGPDAAMAVSRAIKGEINAQTISTTQRPMFVSYSPIRGTLSA